MNHTATPNHRTNRNTQNITVTIHAVDERGRPLHTHTLIVAANTPFIQVAEQYARETGSRWGEYFFHVDVFHVDVGFVKMGLMPNDPSSLARFARNGAVSLIALRRPLKPHDLSRGWKQYGIANWQRTLPIKTSATAIQRSQHRIRAHKHKIAYHTKWAQELAKRARGLDAEHPHHEYYHQQKSAHLSLANKEREALEKNTQKLVLARRTGPAAKTNTGQKTADGLTIWRGPRGGMFVMKGDRKIPVKR